MTESNTEQNDFQTVKKDLGLSVVGY